MSEQNPHPLTSEDIATSREASRIDPGALALGSLMAGVGELRARQTELADWSHATHDPTWLTTQMDVGRKWYSRQEELEASHHAIEPKIEEVLSGDLTSIIDVADYLKDASTAELLDLPKAIWEHQRTRFALYGKVTDNTVRTARTMHTERDADLQRKAEGYQETEQDIGRKEEARKDLGEMQELRKLAFALLGVDKSTGAELWRSWIQYRRDAMPTDPDYVKNTEGHLVDRKLEDFRGILSANFQTMDRLHTDDPGSPQKIFEEFGIRGFGRYDRYDLLDQLRNPERGLVMMSSADNYNNSSRNAAQQLKGMFGSKTKITFMESASPPEMRQHLNHYVKKFGPIDSLVIHTHASETRAVLSENSANGDITIADLEGVDGKPPLLDNTIIKRRANILWWGCTSSNLAKIANKKTGAYVTGFEERTIGFMPTMGRRRIGTYDPEIEDRHGNVISKARTRPARATTHGNSVARDVVQFFRKRPFPPPLKRTAA